MSLKHQASLDLGTTLRNKVNGGVKGRWYIRIYVLDDFNFSPYEQQVTLNVSYFSKFQN